MAKRSIHCPSCLAQLEVDSESRQITCDYCNTTFTIGDESHQNPVEEASSNDQGDQEEKQAELQRIIGALTNLEAQERQMEIEASLSEIDKELDDIEDELCTQQQTDEADGPISHEEEKPKKKSPWKWILIAIIVLFFSALLAPRDQTPSDEPTIPMVEAPEDHSDLEDLNYVEVVSILEDAGFTNIETEADADLIFGLLHEDGEVERVTIGDDSYFDKGDQFAEDELVVVKYHTYRNEKEKEEKEESSDKAKEKAEEPESEPKEEKAKDNDAAADTEEKVKEVASQPTEKAPEPIIVEKGVTGAYGRELRRASYTSDNETEIAYLIPAGHYEVKNCSVYTVTLDIYNRLSVSDTGEEYLGFDSKWFTLKSGETKGLDLREGQAFAIGSTIGHLVFIPDGSYSLPADFQVDEGVNVIETFGPQLNDYCYRLIADAYANQDIYWDINLWDFDYILHSSEGDIEALIDVPLGTNPEETTMAWILFRPIVENNTLTGAQCHFLAYNYISTYMQVSDTPYYVYDDMGQQYLEDLNSTMEAGVNALS